MTPPADNASASNFGPGNGCATGGSTTSESGLRPERVAMIQPNIKIDRRALLEECRQNFGPAPRAFKWQDKQSLQAAPPAWCRTDALMMIYRQRPRLLREGRIVWGHLVQANNLLFNPGPQDCPASIIYGLSPDWDSDLDGLETIAHKIFALKGTMPDDPALQEFARGITDEMRRDFRVQVPAQLLDDAQQGRDLCLTTIMVMRQNLPFGFLTSSAFPLLVLPEHTDATLILPARFWPQTLRDL